MLAYWPERIVLPQVFWGYRSSVRYLARAIGQNRRIWLLILREAKNASFASSMRRVDNGAWRSIPRTGLGRALVLDVPERWEELYRQDCKRIKRSATKANVAEFVAQMKDFAREGISRDMEDNEPGIRCVAAPVRDAQGHIVAAISVSSAVMYMDETRMNELAKKVRGVAEKISTQLGYNALNALESRP